MNDCFDTELIECDECKCVLNGKSVWIIGEAEEALILCEECYIKIRKDGYVLD